MLNSGGAEAEWSFLSNFAASEGVGKYPKDMTWTSLDGTVQEEVQWFVQTAW